MRTAGLRGTDPAEIVPLGATRPSAADRTPPPLGGVAPPRGVYVHFPFCRHRCHYCDFSVKRARAAPVDEWLACLELEIPRWFDAAGWEPPVEIETLFVGGGTPSLLGTSGLERLTAVLSRWLRLDDPRLEWTVEANPSSFDAPTARGWRSLGVSRLSLGVQSLDDGALAWLGRLHDREGALSALRAGLDAGFELVNADLIFGLPEEVARDWPTEVSALAECGVAHVSAYGLTVEPRTPLARWIELGRIDPPAERRYASEFSTVAGRLREAGFRHYEVSNFARPGAECRHNWIYWRGEPYLGLGPSAHSYFPPFRLWNAFRWDAYASAVRTRAGAVEGWERLRPAQSELERLWLSLRTRDGLATSDRAWSGHPGALRLARWRESGFLRERGGRVALTTAGWLRLDELVTEIASEDPSPD